jgi:type I restriction enzyme S subunit
VKAGWQKKPLADVCKFSNGLWKGEKPPFVNVGVIRNTNFTKEGALDASDIAYLDVEAKKFEKRRLQFGDVILEKSGGGPKQPVGRVALFDLAEGDFSFSNFTSALRVLERDILDFRFLHKFLHWTYLSGVTEGMQSHSTGIRNLNGDAYKAIEITFPELSEQRRIVGILDEAFDGIVTAKANAQKNLQNARALFESHLEAVFTQRGGGWVEEPIGSVCEIRHGFSFDGADFSNDIPEGKPLIITPGNFTEDGRLLFNERNTKRFSGKSPAGFLFEVGDLVVVMTDLSSKMKILGKPAFVETDDVLHNQRIGRFVFLNNRIQRRFLYYFMMSERFLKNIKASATGTMVKHTAPKRILSNVIPFPRDQKEQLAVVAKFDALREETQRLEFVYLQKLAALDKLKKSLLEKAFSGELVGQRATSVALSFPMKIAGISTTDLHAGIIAIAFQLHEQKNKQDTFGHVKAEKIAHMVEAHLGIDLGRAPIKDAAGPNDYPHLKRVEHRARMRAFFTFQGTERAGYKIIKGRRFNFLIHKTRLALGVRSPDVDRLLELMLPMNTQQAEVFSTVYAAWKNLLLDRRSITDGDIVFEARENWHSDKLKIPREKFFTAISWMKAKDVIPEGKGRKVSSKAEEKK